MSNSDNNVKSSYDDKGFYLLGFIDEETEKNFYEFAIKHIEPELEKVPEKRKPIKIHIASVGGLVNEATSIVGLIEHYKTRGVIIETHIRSMCASAATLISTSGSEGHRYANPYATIMIHQLSGGAFGELKFLNDCMINKNYLWRLMKKIYKKNTLITEEKFKDIYDSKKDWYIKPQYAKELHIIDHIL